MSTIDDRQLDERLRQAAEHAASLATAPGAELAVRRGRRRDRRRGAAAVLAVAVLVGAVVVVPRLSSDGAGRVAATPGAAVVHLPTQGFDLPVPSGWRVQRELTGTRGGSRSTVVGVVLAPRSGRPAGATITVTTNPYDNRGRGGGRGPVIARPDGRDFRLLPGAGNGEVGRYNLPWAEYPCAEWDACKWPPQRKLRGLLISGTAAPGDQPGRQQVLQVMRQVAISVRAITNALVPPPAPTLPDSTKVLLGTGGSGDTAWQAWIEPLDGNTGFSTHFPKARPTPAKHWEQLEPDYIQRDGTQTQMDCVDWVPGSGLVLSGLAKNETAEVRFELQDHPPVTVTTFGRDNRLPWVAYVSPVLPASSRVTRVVGLDSAGQAIGGETDPFEGRSLCPPSG
jgi:hypothetical protein